MKKLFLLLLFISVIFASQAPILIFSSQSLESFNSQVFLGLEDLVGKVYEKEVSKNTIIYKIQSSYAAEDTLNYLIRNKEKIPIFMVKKERNTHYFIKWVVVLVLLILNEKYLRFGIFMMFSIFFIYVLLAFMK